MKLIKTKIEGVYVLDIDPVEDKRGFFARAWCEQQMREWGINTEIAQCNLSYNHAKGTIRGIHLQKKPYQEVKLVRCVKGSIYDVAVDLRPQSATYGQWVGEVLDDKKCRALYIPEGVGHGYQVLEDGSTVFYQVSTPYQKEAEEGVRWDDPVINIEWPIKELIFTSEKDQQLPSFKEKEGV